MKNKIFTFIIISFIFVLDVLSLLAQPGKIKDEIAGYTKNLPFSINEFNVPAFPAKKYNIVDFGAVGDGITKNTEIFKKVVDSCFNSGGGEIIVPPGIWLTGPIILKSNINLHLERGALIQFTKNFDDYPLIETTYEGQGQFRCISPVYGCDLQNIAITGEGVIDGGGGAWRPVKKYKLTDLQWKELISSGGVVRVL